MAKRRRRIRVFIVTVEEITEEIGDEIETRKTPAAATCGGEPSWFDEQSPRRQREKRLAAQQQRGQKYEAC